MKEYTVDAVTLIKKGYPKESIGDVLLEELEEQGFDLTKPYKVKQSENSFHFIITQEEERRDN